MYVKCEGGVRNLLKIILIRVKERQKAALRFL